MHNMGVELTLLADQGEEGEQFNMYKLLTVQYTGVELLADQGEGICRKDQSLMQGLALLLLSTGEEYIWTFHGEEYMDFRRRRVYGPEKGGGGGKVHPLCMLILLPTMETLEIGWAAEEVFATGCYKEQNSC